MWLARTSRCAAANARTSPSRSLTGPRPSSSFTKRPAFKQLRRSHRPDRRPGSVDERLLPLNHGPQVRETNGQKSGIPADPTPTVLRANQRAPERQGSRSSAADLHAGSQAIPKARRGPREPGLGRSRRRRCAREEQGGRDAKALVPTSAADLLLRRRSGTRGQRC